MGWVTFISFCGILLTEVSYCFYIYLYLKIVDKIEVKVIKKINQKKVVFIVNGISERINNPTLIDFDHLQNLINEGKNPIIQFVEPSYDETLLKTLDKACLHFGEQLEVRFYGYYGDVFDASCLKLLPNVKNLSVDCLTEIVNEDEILYLDHLIHLRLGIYNFDKTDFLSRFNKQNHLTLTISDNDKNNLDLSSLNEFQSLRELCIVGHTKNIEVIGELINLESLTLSKISKKQSLDFVSDLKNLKHLRIILGGRESIEEIDNPAIKNIEIIRVRGLAELGDLARFPKLRSLHIEDQIKLKHINFMPELKYLNEIKILNCKKLMLIDGLTKLSNLEHLRIYGTSLDDSSFIDQQFPTSLNIFAFYTGKNKKDKGIRQRLDELGYTEFSD
jgi:protein phosphatase 1 regulatory subunit 7